MINLRKANIDDCSLIHEMQIKSFKLLLEKYQDHDTNPGAESLERVMTKMRQNTTDYYLIQNETMVIGAIRVVKLLENICRISPMFILPEYQGKGYAQQVIEEVEKQYPLVNTWKLDTIKQESKLCHLYEKMGYQKTGKEEEFQENLTIIHYSKRIDQGEF